MIRVRAQAEGIEWLAELTRNATFDGCHRRGVVEDEKEEEDEAETETEAEDELGDLRFCCLS
jgi:hypothetical protein